MQSKAIARFLPTTTLVCLFVLTAAGRTFAAPDDPAAAASIPPGPYVPGEAYRGANGWIEYHAGDLPVIISAPHGGHLTPSSIPDRVKAACGGNFVTVTDRNTAELALNLKSAFHERTGRYPHVIINRLKRVKLDTNRRKSTAACGDEDAEAAWETFHAFIGTAKQQALDSAWGKGWYLDVHGWRGSKVALGYRLSASDLRRDDAILDSDSRYREGSTFRTFAVESGLPFGSVLLRGDTAIGTGLARDGFPSIPSLPYRAPEKGNGFYQGGYNVITHGCQDGGLVCGVQVEAPYRGIRDTHAHRKAFSESLVRATDVFLRDNFDFRLVTTDDRREARSRESVSRKRTR